MGLTCQLLVQGFCKAALREYQRENPPSEDEEEEEEEGQDDDDDDDDGVSLGELVFLPALTHCSHPVLACEAQSVSGARCWRCLCAMLWEVASRTRMRELATKIKRESRGSGTEFFIAVDLRK